MGVDSINRVYAPISNGPRRFIKIPSTSKSYRLRGIWIDIVGMSIFLGARVPTHSDFANRPRARNNTRGKENTPSTGISNEICHAGTPLAGYARHDHQNYSLSLSLSLSCAAFPVYETQSAGNDCLHIVPLFSTIHARRWLDIFFLSF